MAITGSGSIRTRPVASVQAASISLITDLTMGFIDSPSTLDWTTLSIVTGVASTKPTLYSSLTNPVLVDASGNFAQFSVRNQGSGLAYSISDPPDLSSYTIGQHLWACLFDVLAPSGSDPVKFAVDLGLAVA